MMHYDQYGYPYDDTIGGNEDDYGAGGTLPTTPTVPAAGAGGGNFVQPEGYQGIEYWQGQGNSPIGADGQLAPGFTRTANGYEYAAPQQSYGGLASLASPGRPEYSSLPGFKFTAPTKESLYNDPSYVARRDEGRQAIEQSASGRGTLRTGGNLKDIVNYGQEFASREYGNVWDRAFNVAKEEYKPEVLNWQGRNRVNELEFNRLFEQEMARLDDDYRYVALGASV